MLVVQRAAEKDLDDIIALAKLTWNKTYRSIISQEQIDFMLNKFYSRTVIKEQLDLPSHHFLVAIDENQLMGYAHCIAEYNKVKLSKLYIHPNAQHQGVGKALLHQVETFTRSQSCNVLELNVNRNNPAKYFYLKQGFKIIKEVDIPLEQYWLNDFVMQKELNA